MKILVTGGAGFIGSAVIRHIINNTNDSVVNLDKLTYAGNLENLTEVSNSARYAFEQVDICNRVELDRVFSQYQPDAVMHLAAESHVDRSIDGPAAFIETNIVGTYTLLEAARNYWHKLKEPRKSGFRFHHISTDEVFGDLPHPDDIEQSQSVGSGHAYESGEVLPLFTEATPYAPSSPYSASKASSDHLVRAWRRTYGFPTIITNCSNNYGPYHFPEKLVPHIIINALRGKSLPIYGKGDQIRDWLYVEDHARALYLVVTAGLIGATYNIGGHNEKKNIEVVHTICSILDELQPLSVNFHNSVKNEVSVVSDCMVGSSHAHDNAATYKKQITHVKDRPGHDRRYAIDASKIAEELGWQPEESFETGLRKTVVWYLNNEQWWQRVLNGDYQLARLGNKQ